MMCMFMQAMYQSSLDLQNKIAMLLKDRESVEGVAAV